MEMCSVIDSYPCPFYARIFFVAIQQKHVISWIISARYAFGVGATALSLEDPRDAAVGLAH